MRTRERIKEESEKFNKYVWGMTFSGAVMILGAYHPFLSEQGFYIKYCACGCDKFFAGRDSDKRKYMYPECRFRAYREKLK